MRPAGLEFPARSPCLIPAGQANADVDQVGHDVASDRISRVVVEQVTAAGVVENVASGGDVVRGAAIGGLDDIGFHLLSPL